MDCSTVDKYAVTCMKIDSFWTDKTFYSSLNDNPAIVFKEVIPFVKYENVIGSLIKFHAEVTDSLIEV